MTGDGAAGSLMILAVRRPGWPRRFRTVVAACVAIIGIGIASALATNHVQRNWPVVIVLAALFVAAEHRDRIFVDETGLSGSVAVATASALYFGASGRVLGAFVVCMAGGLYLPHLRHRELPKVAVNAASFGLSGVAAAGVVALMADLGNEPLVLVLAAVPTAVVYWVVNSILLSVATTSLRGGDVIERALDLIKSDTVMLVFAVGGALCGLVMTEIGPWVGIAALTASLVALDVFVLSVPGGPSVLRSTWRMLVTRMGSGVVAGVLAAGVADTVATPGVGVVVGLVAGVAAGLTVTSVVAVGRSRSAGAPLDRRLLVGFAVGELPLVLLAAVAGVVGAEVGAAAGFVTAAALVIAGSLAAGWNRSRGEGASGDDDLLLAAVTEAILDGMPESLPRR